MGTDRRPEMDLFEMIREEHRDITESADRLIGSDPDNRVDALGGLIAKTLTHMSAEEHWPVCWTRR